MAKTLHEFIKSFEPAQSLPFLSDVAKLEWLWTKSYNAADAQSIDISSLSEINPETLMEAVFDFHPSTQLFQSEFPVMSIWSAHHQENKQELLEAISNNSEMGFLIRPNLNVEIILLQPQIFAFYKILTR